MLRATQAGASYQHSWPIVKPAIVQTYENPTHTNTYTPTHKYTHTPTHTHTYIPNLLPQVLRATQAGASYQHSCAILKPAVVQTYENPTHTNTYTPTHKYTHTHPHIHTHTSQTSSPRCSEQHRQVPPISIAVPFWNQQLYKPMKILHTQIHTHTPTHTHTYIPNLLPQVLRATQAGASYQHSWPILKPAVVQTYENPTHTNTYTPNHKYTHTLTHTSQTSSPRCSGQHRHVPISIAGPFWNQQLYKPMTILHTQIHTHTPTHTHTYIPNLLPQVLRATQAGASYQHSCAILKPAVVQTYENPTHTNTYTPTHKYTHTHPHIHTHTSQTSSPRCSEQHRQVPPISIAVPFWNQQLYKPMKILHTQIHTHTHTHIHTHTSQTSSPRCSEQHRQVPPISIAGPFWNQQLYKPMKILHTQIHTHPTTNTHTHSHIHPKPPPPGAQDNTGMCLSA